MALKQAVRINSVSGLCLTKLDVLDGLDSIRICVGYEKPDGRDGTPRFGSEYYSQIKPRFEELPGWRESTAGVKSRGGLPANARAYIRRIEEAVCAPVDIISTGPDREETIVLNNPFS